MKKIKFITSILIVIVTLLTMVPVSMAASNSQVFYNIDMSTAVLKSRINQRVEGDCAVVSMATVEAYLYGATSTADKNTVYNALVSKNKDNDYAYWSNCGYVSHSSINWTEVYNQLAKGYPVIVHRPAANGKSQHWAVVAGYKGSTTKIEKDKFIIVNVWRETKTADIMTSAEWAKGTKIDRMVTRKNGIAITGLSGIRFAINHPSALHKSGNGHGVYGYITSNTNIKSVQVMVTNLDTQTNVFNKTVNPNAKSYSPYKLDSEITFAKYPQGKYLYTIKVTDQNSSRAYQKYFEISSTYPSTLPVRKITFNYNTGSMCLLPQTVSHGSVLKISSTVPTKSGYTFKGWTVLRESDNTYYSTTINNWCEVGVVSALKNYTPKTYQPGEYYTISYEWLKGAFASTEFTFHAVWEKNSSSSVLDAIDSVPSIFTASTPLANEAESGTATTTTAAPQATTTQSSAAIKSPAAITNTTTTAEQTTAAANDSTTVQETTTQDTSSSTAQNTTTTTTTTSEAPTTVVTADAADSTTGRVVIIVTGIAILACLVAIIAAKAKKKK